MIVELKEIFYVKFARRLLHCSCRHVFQPIDYHNRDNSLDQQAVDRFIQ